MPWLKAILAVLYDAIGFPWGLPTFREREELQDVVQAWRAAAMDCRESIVRLQYETEKLQVELDAANARVYETRQILAKTKDFCCGLRDRNKALAEQLAKQEAMFA